MANWIRNKIVMRRIVSLPLFTTAVGGTPNFNFDKIAPTPKDLMIEYIPALEAQIEMKVSGVYPSGSFPFIPGITEDKINALVSKYTENKEKYGFSAWYGWRVAHWGTPKNTSSTKVIDGNTIVFDTEWEPPCKVVQKLSELYPADEVYHYWAGEGHGLYCGQAVYFAGMRTSIDHLEDLSQESLCLYTELFGPDPRICHDKETGEYTLASDD